jgi:hypothetical protein
MSAHRNFAVGKFFRVEAFPAMLADDDADVRACVVATLGRPGYVVLEAAR